MKYIKCFFAAFLLPCLITFSAKSFAEEKITHNPWELIIYRPENSWQINDIRCYLKAEDMEGNDVTSKKIKATYEWISSKDKVNFYQNSYWLQGGVAMHLNLKPGRYKFTVKTPYDKQYPYPVESKKDWTSNEFIYDTSNPAKVIFVYPTANENGFYNGGWVISAKSPKYYKFTKPKIVK